MSDARAFAQILPLRSKGWASKLYSRRTRPAQRPPGRHNYVAKSAPMVKRCGSRRTSTLAVLPTVQRTHPYDTVKDLVQSLHFSVSTFVVCVSDERNRASRPSTIDLRRESRARQNSYAF